MTDELDPNLELYPAWRQVLVNFRDAGFAYGDILPHTWLWEQFECSDLADQKHISAERYNQLKLKLLNQFEPFKEALLDQDQIDLQSVPGVGYELVPPDDQTGRALKETTREVDRVWRKGMARAMNVNTSLLTAEQRRERIDNIARLALLGRQIKPPRELPPPDE